jgi:predicted esterase
MVFQKSIVTEIIENNSKHVLIVLHGYGQLAKYFIKKFDHLIGYDIIAVQAPNLFYLNGFSGRVGANWMTKENRDDAIADQRKILESLHAKIQEKYESISLCGFSQGVATASRWLHWNVIPFDKVLLYAGEIAPETFDYFANTDASHVRYVVGEDDEFFTSDKIKMYQKHLNDKNVALVLNKVKGVHSIDTEVVSNVFG